jgi:hypothetical protein
MKAKSHNRLTPLWLLLFATMSEMPMCRRTFTIFGTPLVLLLCLSASGQAPVHGFAELHDDPGVILELGAASSWNTTGGATAFAPNLAAETTPIENWLELEAGVTPYFTRTSTEWDVDLLFKKPWTLSKKAEFMIGIGPEWVHLRQNGKASNSVAAEAAGDFMFWPDGHHHFGWFLEPAYDYSFAGGHQQSIGMTAGLLIGLRRR